MEKKEEHKYHKVHHETKPAAKKFGIWSVFILLTLVLGILIFVNIYMISGINNSLNKNTEAAKENLRPAKIELTVIKNSKCSDCFDISQVINRLKNSNLNVTLESISEFDSKDGKAIIDKYKIEKVPTVIVTGEIDKVNDLELEKKDNALLLTKIKAPYTNAATGKVEGRVALFILNDPKCTECNNLTSFIVQIKGAGIKISDSKNVDPGSDNGKELIKKYSIDFVPSIILSKEAAAYDIMQQSWPQVGTKESDGSYVLRTVYPPYINLTTDKLRGLVDISYLTDKSCEECYNVNMHRSIITSPSSFGMKLNKEETYDISDAKAKQLVLKYNITQVPTIILSGETSVYPTSKILRQFFSIEKDGSFVFRRVQSVGTYKDLTTNEIVKAAQQNQQQGAGQ